MFRALALVLCAVVGLQEPALHAAQMEAALPKAASLPVPLALAGPLVSLSGPTASFQLVPAIPLAQAFSPGASPRPADLGAIAAPPLIAEPAAKILEIERLGQIVRAENPAESAALHFDGAAGKETPGAEPPAFSGPGSHLSIGPASSGRVEARTNKAPPRSGFQKTPLAEKTLLIGAALAVALPVLYRVFPPDILLYTAPAAILAVGIVLLAVDIARRTVGRPAPKSRKAKAVLAGAALIVGLLAGSSGAAVRTPFVERGPSALTRNTAIRQLDDAFSRQVLEEMAKTEEGRLVLGDLRDLGGRVRLPAFFISDKDEDVAATYDSIFDAVFISRGYIEEHGWTEKTFLSFPELQRRLARELAELVAHELRHATQARRPIFFPGHLTKVNNMEEEYEAYITGLLYVHERLRADPRAEIRLGHYESMIDDLDGFLKGRDTSRIYKHNVHIDAEHYNKLLADLRARWPALSVEGYVLLAKRVLPGDPKKAEEYMTKAKNRAAAHHLPAPELH